MKQPIKYQGLPMDFLSQPHLSVDRVEQLFIYLGMMDAWSAYWSPAIVGFLDRNTVADP